MSIRIFVLGSRDPEMDAIEAIARQSGARVCYACDGAGRRMMPGTEPSCLDGGDLDSVAYGATVILVEIPPSSDVYRHLAAAAITARGHMLAVDHHGDREEAAYPPEEYMDASSLGQVIAFLAGSGVGGDGLPAEWGQPFDLTGYPDEIDCGEFVLPEESGETGYSDADEDRAAEAVYMGVGSNLVVRVPPVLCALAAADHCLRAAYAGNCPGADLSPGSAGYLADMEATRVAFLPSCPAEDFPALIETARQTLREAPDLQDEGVGLGGLSIADLCGLAGDWGPETPLGERYPRLFPCGPRVAAIEGRPYIVEIRARHGRAIRLGGFDGANAAHRGALVSWREMAGAYYGCHGPDAPRPLNLYAYPERGMAGGTLREDAPAV